MKNHGKKFSGHEMVSKSIWTSQKTCPRQAKKQKFQGQVSRTGRPKKSDTLYLVFWGCSGAISNTGHDARILALQDNTLHAAMPLLYGEQVAFPQV
jgi:hypothetical protein